MTVRSLVKKDRIYPMKPLPRDQFAYPRSRVRSLCADDDCLFVNGQQVFNELLANGEVLSVDWSTCVAGFRRLDPPHEKLWIEGAALGERFAFCSTSSILGLNHWRSTVDIMATAGGPIVGIYGTAQFEVKDHILSAPSLGLSAGVPPDRLMGWLAMYLTTIQMMHCRNVVLVNESAPRGASRPPHLEAPGTFWKTIVIRPDEQHRRTGVDVFSDESKGLVRLHWVRGHYRHFKDGSMCYVMPHQRGNAELGRTIPEYKVAR